MRHPAPFYRDNNITLYHDDILTTCAIPNSSVDLVVTSPPYNVGISYSAYQDDVSYAQYLDFTRAWLARCLAFLKDDGRLCLNIPLDKTRGGRECVGADITTTAKQVGFKYHSTIIWNEGNISRRTAWGSWMSASAPHIISPVELIVVLYKGRWRKTSGSHVSDITRDEFISWTWGLWTFSGESKKKVGHPAPFPLELPRRCIKLFSYVGDTVLDPFAGSGTTLIAAATLGRVGIGVEIDADYCELAKRRLANVQHPLPGLSVAE